MDSRTLLTIATLMIAVLSGCIGYGDPSNEQAGNPDDTSTTANTEPRRGMFFGDAVAEPIYTESWAGPSRMDDPVPIDRDYDFLEYSFSHAGQVLGRPAFTTGDGEAMDDGLIGGRSGAMSLVRVVPGAAGTGHFAFEGASSGAGSVSIVGVDNIEPLTLFALTWSGQTQELPIMGGASHFLVLDGYEKLDITISASGQTAPGVRILNAEGDEVAASGPTSGADSSTTTVAATAGIWTVETNGVANGAFNVLVTKNVQMDDMV